jgi:acetaldehyde dehydrogenase / alcohol dehydrogenase
MAKEKGEISATAEVDALVKRAQKALEEYMKLDQEQVDFIIKEMALAGSKHHMLLAKMAVEETNRGIVEDKATKNIFATEYVYHSIKYDKTVGIIEENLEEDYILLGEPVGVIAGITPVTNPTSTTMFKSIIATKSRNPIIFAFHPSSQKCSIKAAEIMRDAAIKAGAPKDCILWIEHPSLEATTALMNHPDVAIVLATGGSGMVRAAYSTGKPALGVGPGNVPCFIDKTANIKQAVTDLILSKFFDNGMVCASEQGAIIHSAIFDEVVDFMKAKGCYFTNKEETEKIAQVVIKEGGGVNPNVVGKNAYEIAQMAGVTVPEKTKILCCEIASVGPEYPLSREKLSPTLAIIKAKDSNEGIDIAEKMILLGGMGHTAVIHSFDSGVITKFAERVKVGRIVVNQPSSHGAIGDIYNTFMPSLTLGCGTYGSNITTSNVTAIHLINVKRMSKRRVNMQWFKIPEKIFFEKNAVQYLEKMPDIHRIFIVTDPVMVKLGYVDKVTYYLDKRLEKVEYEIYSDVEPDPCIETVLAGAAAMKKFQPDAIIAIGGGSPIDAAKTMWLFYEYPDSDFASLAIKFLDIRKRIYKFPKLGKKAKFVAIPTTSGTGSEVTAFSVISDKKKNMKYPLADYALTPDVAILDPNFVLTMPKTITAHTGLDALCHAIESYVSILASDYTEGLSLRAILMIFEFLPKAYHHGDDFRAREKMHNASCIAGMAFTNAFLGINHSLAHKLGGEFSIPHGLANALLMPHVIAYNGELNPTKFVSFPRYDHYKAPRKYAEIASALKLKASTPEEGVNSLVDAIKTLNEQLDVPKSIQAYGIEEKLFMSKVDELAEKAFEDQCTPANPRLPLIPELAEILRKTYYGQ